MKGSDQTDGHGFEINDCKNVSLSTLPLLGAKKDIHVIFKAFLFLNFRIVTSDVHMKN